MAKYQIIPNDKEKIAAYNQHLSEQVELYKTYDLEKPEIHIDYSDGKTLMGGDLWINDMKFVVSSPQDNGFVVKRDWSAPDEVDPVLRAWGSYEEVNTFRNRDDTLVAWFDLAYKRVTGHGHKREIKCTLRIRCFAPRRSKRFAPKITLYQSARDRHDRDREVAMKPARAFSMMFPELEHKQIIELTDKYLERFATRKLFIKEGTDAADFVKAYSWEQAPTDNINTTYSRKSSASSCMRYDFDHLPVHPVSVYASGDFKMLWTEDADGRIASRCVVRVMPDGGYQGGPIYGVSEQAIDILEHHIHTNGGEYGRDGSWEGARLVRKPVTNGEGFYGPYIDLEPRRLLDDGEYLVVSHGGDVEAHDYQGVIGGYACHCYSCNSGLHEDDSYYSEHTDETYCNDCYYSEHFYCEWSDRDCHNDASVEVNVPSGSRRGYDTDVISQDYLDYSDEFVLCDNDHEYWHTDLAYYCEHEDCYISQRAIDTKTYFISDWDCECYPSDQKAITDTGETICIEEAEADELELDETNNIWKKKEEND